VDCSVTRAPRPVAGLALFQFRRYVLRDRRHFGTITTEEGSMTLMSRRPVEGIA
jgi:hypothetical protein